MKQHKYFLPILIILLSLLLLLFLFFHYNPREGFFDTNYKKTIYLIWRNKIANSGTYHGFGDKLRGSIFLYDYCYKNNINFKIDATDDICSEFLKNVVSSDYETIKNKELLNIADLSVTKTEETIQNELEKNDTIYVFTNVCTGGWPNVLSEHEKLFAKFICEPKDDIMNDVNNKIKNLPENFGVQHFRFSDNVFANDIDESNKLFKKYFDLLVENKKPTDILFTNSNNFKKYVKDKLNIKTIDCDNELCKIAHIGSSTDKESVKNSFIEFLILSKSKYIKSHTCYNWASNFVQWPASIYDIPFENVYIDENNVA
jgi:hypothetical protein